MIARGRLVYAGRYEEHYRLTNGNLYVVHLRRPRRVYPGAVMYNTATTNEQ